MSVIGRHQDRKIIKAAVLSRTMKLLVLALAVTLLLTAGEALNCHRCVPKKAGGACELTVETCKPEKDCCAAARFLREPYGHYQKCMAMSDCAMLAMNAYIDINCCRDDMCNTLLKSHLEPENMTVY
uniref:MAC-inhibitory protein n=1 Tax=Monopterus albus TaxID=43700 RepID=A0A3Q3JXL1_MONAL